MPNIASADVQQTITCQMEIRFRAVYKNPVTDSETVFPSTKKGQPTVNDADTLYSKFLNEILLMKPC